LHKQITKALAAGSTPKLKVLSGEPLGKLQLVAAAYGWLGAVTADNREEVAESLLAKAREQRIAYRAVAVLVLRKSLFDSVAHQVVSFMFGDAKGPWVPPFARARPSSTLETYLCLEETKDTPANLKDLDASLPTLRRHAANIVLARRRSEAHHAGRYYMPGAIVYTYDPLHLFHNFVQSLLKQLKDKGTEDPGGERELILDHLIEAAESLGDKLVLDILHGAFDWNSHACSSLVLDNPKLVAAML
jgi:hypothetical protein